MRSDSAHFTSGIEGGGEASALWVPGPGAGVETPDTVPAGVHRSARLGLHRSGRHLRPSRRPAPTVRRSRLSGRSRPSQPSLPPGQADGLARQESRRAWVLLVPTIVVVVGVALYPLVQTVRLSFTNARLGSSRAVEYVGFWNYRDLFSDFAFLDAIRNTIYFTVVSVGAELVLGMVIALVIHSRFRGRGLMRTAVLVPWAIPTVVSAQMWRWMYNDVFGVVNDLLMRLQLIAQPVAWMAVPGVAMHAIIAVDVWKTTPFMALLLLAGLQVIPGELYEAARVDGAGAVRRFFFVTLPLLKPAILVALIFRSLDALRVFDVIFVMTAGASGTETMATYARRILIQFQQLGYGSSISVVIFVIIAAFTVLYRKALGAGRG